jgi:glycosyltransferase involved in cell wall biosynthesis
MPSPAIYYAFSLPPVTGGDFVSLDHIAALRRAGLNAMAFYGAGDDGFRKFSVPVARLGIAFQPDDILVLGEVYSWQQARPVPGIKVMHNQNPYLTFMGIESIAALNAYPLDHILVPSDFCSARLTELGVKKSILRVHPALPDFFAPAPKLLRIAYAPGKRPNEAAYVKGYFQAAAPDYAQLPWIAMENMPRKDCAAAMGEAAVYAAFPHLESLGLMNLEAMASGCHVVGYTGHGGAEYASNANGDWIADGDHAAFVQQLIAACRLFESGAPNPKVTAGLATAAQFSQGQFERELAAAWATILGDWAAHYRL